jgi:hypothetical protein
MFYDINLNCLFNRIGNSVGQRPYITGTTCFVVGVVIVYLGCGISWRGLWALV